MYNCILIFGTTASGKSDLALNLALRYGGEIINCDSQQIYKHFNTGTAKPTQSDFKKVKHHLFDYVEINEDYSVSRYHNDAMQVFSDLQKKNILPIFVGGTGLYIDSLLYNHDYGYTDKNEQVRKKYMDMVFEFGNDYVFNMLQKVDPVSASKIHPNDTKRVVRALEIADSGKIKSNQTLTRNEGFRPLVIYANIQREILYERINNRVDVMLKEGLFDEVNDLHEKGLICRDFKLPIGYSEWIDYYAGTQSFDQTIELIKQHSRNYAKRQKTWFKRRDFAVEYDHTHSTMQSLFDILDKYFGKK